MLVALDVISDTDKPETQYVNPRHVVRIAPGPDVKPGTDTNPPEPTTLVVLVDKKTLRVPLRAAVVEQKFRSAR